MQSAEKIAFEKGVSLELFFLMLFLAVGPIYWLPSLPPSALLAAKLLLLGVVFLYPYLSFRRDIYAVPSFLMPALVGLFLFEAPSAIKHLSFEFLMVVGASYFIVLGYSLSKLYGGLLVVDVMYRSTMVFSLFAALVVVDYALNGVFVNPVHDVRLYLYQTGFHGGRTGWAGICNIFLAVALMGVVHARSWWERGLLWIAAVILLANLFMVDSRGGLITASLVVGVFVIRVGLRSPSRLVVLMFVMAGLVGGLIAQFGDRLVESRTYLSIFAPSELRSGVTTGRVDAYQQAVALFYESPVLGVGEVDMREYGQNAEKIHNVWLRVLVERGFLALLGFMVFAGSVFYFALRGQGSKAVDVSIVFLAAMIPTLFEPTGVFGNYFASAFFWFAIGVFLHKQDFFINQMWR